MGDNETRLYIFPTVILYIFFLFFAHLWWFGGWCFGVLDLVFGVGLFSGWGFETVVRGLLGFFGIWALYINIEE